MKLSERFPDLLLSLGAAAMALRSGPTDADLRRIADQIELATAKPDLPSRRSRKRDHVQAIARKCKVQSERPDRLVTVIYRDHMALYDMSGDRPSFVIRNDLAKPEEPRKIVQDGMRLAAVWHKHPERRPKPPLSIKAGPVSWRNMYAGVDPAKNDMADAMAYTFWTPGDASHFKAAWDGLRGEAASRPGTVHIGTIPAGTVVTKELVVAMVDKWYTESRRSAAPKPMQDFADVDQGDGRLLNPDAFDWTPEMHRIIGAGKTMSDLLAMWHTLAAAARWKR